MKRFLFALLSAISLFVEAGASPTSAIRLDSPPSGQIATAAFSIDPSGSTGTIVGTYVDWTGTDMAYWIGGPGTGEVGTSFNWGYTQSRATCAGRWTNGGYGNWFGQTHALWIYGFSTLFDYHPGPQFVQSHIYGMYDGLYPEFVGDATDTAGMQHAIYWPPGVSPQWYTDLTPTTPQGMQAIALSVYPGTAGRQVGAVYYPPKHIRHAAMWLGTSYAWFDLHPGAGYRSSQANSVSSPGYLKYIECGEAELTDGTPHAVYWLDSPSFFFDINPNPHYSSKAYGASGSNVVGYFQYGNGSKHAFLYNTFNGTMTDLQSLVASSSTLGPGYTDSIAYSMDFTGRIVGVAYGPSGFQAVLWQ